MANVYSRLSKINNALGRSDYISNPKRQEEILLHRTDLNFGWDFISKFEAKKSNTDKENWEARELVIALPNELSEDIKKLEKVCGELTKKLVGSNQEKEYAVHWNKDKTNLHVHILFSERARVKELQAKKYKRDMWYDKDSNKMTKANAENSELRFKKGQVMLDKNGQTRYESDPFTIKNIKFKSRSFLLDKQYVIQEVLKNNGFELDVQENSTPYLSQKKLYKGARKDYLEVAKAYNKEVKEYNKSVQEHLEFEPDQIKTYQEIREVIQIDIKLENRKSRKLSVNAVKVIRDIKDYVVNLVSQIKESLIDIINNEKLETWWNDNKKEMMELLEDTDEREQKQERMSNFIEAVDNVIEDQINTLEEFEEIERGNYGPTR